MPNTTVPTDSHGYLQVIAARAAENIPLVAKRVELDGVEREAFAVVEAVCADIAAGRRT
jgi:hypothetical protein